MVKQISKYTHTYEYLEVYLNDRLLAYASNFWAMRIIVLSYSYAKRETFHDFHTFAT